MRFTLLIFLWFVSTAAIDNASYAGGVAIVPLLGVSSEQPPIAFMEDRRVRIEKLPSGEWAAIVGIALGAKPKETKYIGYHTIEGKTEITSFRIGEKSYPTQRLTIDARMEALDEKTIARVVKERQIVKEAIGKFSEDIRGDLQMSLPLIAPISSRFGLRRIINKTPRNPHGGTDLAAPKNTPIKAPSGGYVALFGEHFYCGRFVLLNHGEGLFTLYCHLEKHNVSDGKRVKTGDVIGYVGATGRVTGAHLHWSAALNGAWFDPLLLVGSENVAKLAP
ncbi:MAG: peptidoglycan DD-metalloendopeptidase family protein [Helicobacteraceae bacterium]|jgi:murein DD-endopeptidase MepM/ murein hydrolase activator NlpD|nr:peptidoglycan DD-metalloendopeptidase family protein [Helicobacteraceae bacterium]